MKKLIDRFVYLILQKVLLRVILFLLYFTGISVLFLLSFPVRMLKRKPVESTFSLPEELSADLLDWKRQS